MATRSYNSKQVDFVCGGVQMVDGAADGDFLTIEWDEDEVGMVVGARGDVMKWPTNVRSVTITARYNQTALENARFMTFVNRNRASFGTGDFEMLVRDRSTGEILIAPVAWVQKLPPRGYGREGGVREWTLRTGEGTPDHEVA